MARVRRMYEYLSDPFDVPPIEVDYTTKPVVAFLTQTVHLCDAVNHCKRHFPKNLDGNYTKDGRHALNLLSCSTLASMMGNFETFERALFAEVFELTAWMPNFQVNGCIKKLKNETSVNIDVVALSGYRGYGAAAGTILADRLGNWHTPSKVSAYFKAMFPEFSGFNKFHTRDLATLWQLRHSIVHTAGTITRPDAQKVPDLSQMGDTEIVVPPTFVDAVGRRLHRVVRAFVMDLQDKTVAFAGDAYEGELRQRLDAALELRSPRNVWLQ